MIKLHRRIFRLRSVAALGLLTVAATLAGSSTSFAQLIYGIGGTDTGAGPNAAAYTLFTFDAATPGATTTVGTVNTSAGYVLESIAFQPSTGQLFGYQYNNATSSGQLVTINRSTAGAVTTVGAPIFLNSISGSAGPSAAISFNPANGAIRLDTGTGGNFRINAGTGALIAADQSLQYVAGDNNAGKTFQISTIAYLQNNPTTLYGLDYINNTLVTQNITAGTSDPSGRLSSVGTNIGVTAKEGPGTQGLTLGLNGVLYLNANVTTDGVGIQDRFYTVNLTNGLASGGTFIGGSSTFNTVDIAAFVPEPGTYALMISGGLVLAGVAYRRRRQSI